MTAPRTLTELLAQAAEAIEGVGLPEVEEAGEKLERLKQINDSWMQTDEEREAVDNLLSNIISLLEELPYSN